MPDALEQLRQAIEDEDLEAARARIGAAWHERESIRAETKRLIVERLRETHDQTPANRAAHRIAFAFVADFIDAFPLEDLGGRDG